MRIATLLVLNLLIGELAQANSCEDLFNDGQTNHSFKELEMVIKNLSPLGSNSEANLSFRIGKNRCHDHPREILDWLWRKYGKNSLLEYSVLYIIRPKNGAFNLSEGTSTIDKISFQPYAAVGNNSESDGWFYHFVIFHRPSDKIIDIEGAQQKVFKRTDYFEIMFTKTNSLLDISNDLYIVEINGLDYHEQIPSPRSISGAFPTIKFIDREIASGRYIPKTIALWGY